MLFIFSFGLVYFIIFDLASNSPMLPFSYYRNFHLAHSWSTICSVHTVPREMGVARGEAFVTLRCQIHRWASTRRLTGSFPWSDSLCGESWKIKTLLFCKFINSSHFDNQDTVISNGPVEIELVCLGHNGKAMAEIRIRIVYSWKAETSVTHQMQKY